MRLILLFFNFFWLGESIAENQSLNQSINRDFLLQEVQSAWNNKKLENLNEKKINLTKETKRSFLALEKIVVPYVFLDEASLEEVVQFFRGQISIYRQENPSFPEINFIIQVSQEASQRKITLKLRDVPLSVLLDKVCQLGKFNCFFDSYAFVISDLRKEKMKLEKIQVSLDFLQNLFNKSDIQKKNKFNLQKALEEQGFTFPDRAMISYLPSSSYLIIRHYPSVIDEFKKLFSPSFSEKQQLLVKTKIFRVSDTDLKELGFDWFIAPFSSQLSGDGERKYSILGGGEKDGDYQSLSSGNRNNSNALPQNFIDSLLLSSENSLIPGFLVWKRFSPFQFQVLVRALEQSRKEDFLIHPEIVIQSGKRAYIHLGREFPYPTEFSEPQIPNSVKGDNIVITPSTPSAFEFKKLGSVLTLDAEILPNSNLIDIEIHPIITNFEGFIDYGSPITLGDTFINNRIELPLFEKTTTKTRLTVEDGSNFLIGGLSRVYSSEFNDEVPILSKIPLLGFLFRHKGKKEIKEFVLIFVNVKRIDVLGNTYEKKNL